MAAFRSHLGTGRPLGDEGFVAGLETILARPLHRRKPGPPAGHKPIGDKYGVPNGIKISMFVSLCHGRL